jgi:hypothetical protein
LAVRAAGDGDAGREFCRRTGFRIRHRSATQGFTSGYTAFRDLAAEAGMLTCCESPSMAWGLL